MRDIIRRCKFAPYRKGMGPSFTLILWDTGKTGEYGKSRLGYELKMHTPITRRAMAVAVPTGKSVTTVLFSGEDYYCSPCHAIDSDATVAGIMTFLTLRPGDTDSDYFKDYNTLQLEYCSNHAETLSCETTHRFGEY